MVQLYIGDEKCSLERPTKELKKFSKVNIQPGQTIEVEFTIEEDDLKFYDDRKREWVVEPGKFKLYIGPSSTSIPITSIFEYN